MAFKSVSKSWRLKFAELAKLGFQEASELHRSALLRFVLPQIQEDCTQFMRMWNANPKKDKDGISPDELFGPSFWAPAAPSLALGKDLTAEAMITRFKAARDTYRASRSGNPATLRLAQDGEWEALHPLELDDSPVPGEDQHQAVPPSEVSDVRRYIPDVLPPEKRREVEEVLDQQAPTSRELKDVATRLLLDFEITTRMLMRSN